MNLYGFAGGDPVNFSDPFGLCANPTASGLGSLQCALEDLIGGIAHGPAALWNEIKASPHKEFVGNLAMVPLTFAEGPEEAAVKLTRWGWTGTAKYRGAVKQIAKGLTHLDVPGKVPTQAEALDLIKAAGGVVDRIEEAHAVGGVSSHTYPHINYTTGEGAKATVRITEVVPP